MEKSKPITMLRNAWQWLKVKKNLLMSLLELDRHDITSICKGLNFILLSKAIGELSAHFSKLGVMIFCDPIMTTSPKDEFLVFLIFVLNIVLLCLFL